MFRFFDIPAYFILQQLLVWPEDKVEKGKVVGPVYHITCDDCCSDASYVGETEISLKTQFLEHWKMSSVGSEVIICSCG